MTIDLKATGAIPVAVRHALGLPVSVALYGAANANTAAANTTAIHAARDAAGVGGRVHIPGNLSLSHNGLALSVAGQVWDIAGTLTLANGADADSIHITGAGTVVTGGGTIDGNSAGQSGGSGGVWLNATGAACDGLTITDTWGVGITGDGNDLRASGNTVTETGSTGIMFRQLSSAVSRTNLEVTGNTVSNTVVGISGIQVYGRDPGTATRARIAYNDVSIVANASGGMCIEVHDLARKSSIVGNSVKGGQMGISVSASNTSTVVGNTVDGPSSVGIELAASTACTVAGNTIDGNAVTDLGVSISNTGGGGHTLTGNTIYNYDGAGSAIKAVNGNDNGAIVGNTVSGWQPIWIQSNDGWTVIGNIVDGGGNFDGVDFESCTNCTAAYNVFHNCPRAGVYAFSGGMTGLVIGPNVLKSGTTVHLDGDALGAGSRLIRGNVAATGLSSITVGASPFTHTAVQGTELVYVLGGTVSSIAKNSVTIATATSATMPVPVWLEAGESVVVTYSVAPTMTKDRK